MEKTNKQHTNHLLKESQKSWQEKIDRTLRITGWTRTNEWKGLFELVCIAGVFL